MGRRKSNYYIAELISGFESEPYRRWGLKTSNLPMCKSNEQFLSLKHIYVSLYISIYMYKYMYVVCLCVCVFHEYLQVFVPTTATSPATSSSLINFY